MVSKSLFSSNTDEWATPDSLFKKLDRDFHFTLDVCASKDNHKCHNYFDKQSDGLNQKWSGVCWMNPPYSEIEYWVKKAHDEGHNGCTVVCLIPARTDTKWWHNYVMQAHKIYLLTKRVTFGSAKNSAPFPCAIVVFNGQNTRQLYSMYI